MPVIFLCYNFEVCSMCNYESEVAQTCLTLCNPVDCILPGSSIHGILQARILEWVTISFFRRSSKPRDRTLVYLHWRQMLYPLNHLILCLYFLILVVCIFLSFLDKSTMTLDAFINIFKEFAFGSIDFSLSLICLIILLISALTLIIFFHHLLWIYFTLLFLASLDGTLDYCFF